MAARHSPRSTPTAASSPTRCCTSTGSPARARMRADRRRRGSALLDVVIALVVLGLSGTAMITLLGQTAHSVRAVRDTERDVRQASDELGRFVVYDRARLAAMVGRR